MAKLQREMVKLPIIEVVPAYDDSRLLKMEKRINQQGETFKLYEQISS